MCFFMSVLMCVYEKMRKYRTWERMSSPSPFAPRLRTRVRAKVHCYFKLQTSIVRQSVDSSLSLRFFQAPLCSHFALLLLLHNNNKSLPTSNLLLMHASRIVHYWFHRLASRRFSDPLSLLKYYLPHQDTAIFFAFSCLLSGVAPH